MNRLQAAVCQPKNLSDGEGRQMMMASAFLDQGWKGCGRHSSNLLMIAQYRCCPNISRLVGRNAIGDCVLLIDCFHKLADDQGNTLYPFDFFLSSYQLSFQASAIRLGTDPRESHATGLPLLILNVFFL